MPFVKIDCDILKSSLWPEKPQRDTFITALLMAEPFEVKVPMAQLEVDSFKETGWKVPPGWYGFLRAASAGILFQAGIDKGEGIEALRALGSTDHASKSKKCEGRRLVRVEGGYVVINYIEYRDRDHTSAERSRRWRQRQKAAEKTPGKTVRVAVSKPVGGEGPEWEARMRAVDENGGRP